MSTNRLIRIYFAIYIFHCKIKDDFIWKKKKTYGLLSEHSRMKIIVKSEVIIEYLNNQQVLSIKNPQNITYDKQLIPSNSGFNYCLQIFVVILLWSYLFSAIFMKW